LTGDRSKAVANLRKHGVSFEVAATVFSDPRLLTIPDLKHGTDEERWLSIGWASNGKILAVIHLWSEPDPETTKIRVISARIATQTEIRRYAKHEEL
jgi:uncharacterized protein